MATETIETGVIAPQDVVGREELSHHVLQCPFRDRTRERDSLHCPIYSMFGDQGCSAEASEDPKERCFMSIALRKRQVEQKAIGIQAGLDYADKQYPPTIFREENPTPQ